MKTLYLDCQMGAAGDMLTAALIELLPNPDAFIEELNGLGLPGVIVRKESSAKCGITGTHISVTVKGVEEESHDYHECGHHDQEHHGHKHHGHEHHGHEHHTHEHCMHDHHHNSLHDIEHIVRDHLAIPENVKDDVMAVYQLIADAESHAHGRPVSDIHFHEVGTMDAIMDITAVCMLIHRIAPDQIIASPIHVGSGQVWCAHGILPVPAPATAYILKDIPIYGGRIKGELCTPTGAALLKHFVTQFGNMPVMKTTAIGYGMGKKDFEAANCVRAMLGETEDKTDDVLELSCNVDDMTAEQIGFAMDCFFAGGALEVYTIPIGMKKSRPGTLIRVLCKEKDKTDMIALIFKHTTTIGIRTTTAQRYVLDRTITMVDTPYGTIRRKDVSGYGVKRSKYEYDDLAQIAKQQGISIKDVIESLY